MPLLLPEIIFSQPKGLNLTDPKTRSVFYSPVFSQDSEEVCGERYVTRSYGYDIFLSCFPSKRPFVSYRSQLTSISFPRGNYSGWKPSCDISGSWITAHWQRRIMEKALADYIIHSYCVDEPLGNPNFPLSPYGQVPELVGLEWTLKGGYHYSPVLAFFPTPPYIALDSAGELRFTVPRRKDRSVSAALEMNGLDIDTCSMRPLLRVKSRISFYEYPDLPYPPDPGITDMYFWQWFYLIMAWALRPGGLFGINVDPAALTLAFPNYWESRNLLFPIENCV
jgi:hypothetical protein